MLCLHEKVKNFYTRQVLEGKKLEEIAQNAEMRIANGGKMDLPSPVAPTKRRYDPNTNDMTNTYRQAKFNQC